MKNKGFTLIELVVVIVILGILAVTAAPRFLNLQEDARKSALQGLKGAIEGAVGITYGKAAVDGVEMSSGAVDVAGVETIFGFPTATSSGIETAVFGLDTNDWSVAHAVQDTTTPAYTVVTFFNATHIGVNAIIETGCYVRYTEASGTETEDIALTSVIDSNC